MMLLNGNPKKFEFCNCIDFINLEKKNLICFAYFCRYRRKKLLNVDVIDACLAVSFSILRFSKASVARNEPVDLMEV